MSSLAHLHRVLKKTYVTVLLLMPLFKQIVIQLLFNGNTSKVVLGTAWFSLDELTAEITAVAWDAC